MGFLSNLFAVGERRSLENPSTPLSAPDDWLFDSLGSFRASSGVNVNRETALTYDAYWRCVALLSGDVAKLPLCPYKRLPTSGKVEDESHPSYRLLHYEFSPEISALDGKRLLTLHALCEGNGYAHISRDGLGRPIELWPLSPMKTYPVRENRRLWYVTEFGTGDARQQRKLKAEDVFHLKGLSFDGLVGYSAVAKMREALGLAIAYENFGSIHFRNNARPGIILKHPGRLKPEAKQNLRESWERMHSGLENSHRTAVLEEGMDLVQMQINLRDSQLLEGKAFSRVQIANFFGVPPHKVGDNSRTSYNSLEQENEAYIEDGGGLGFWLPAWSIECWRKLLTDGQKESMSHLFAFKKRELLRANLSARSQYYVAMVTNGILTPDEAREEEGYNPRPDGKGGEVMQPMNLGKPGEKPQPALGPAPAPGQPKKDNPFLETKASLRAKDDDLTIDEVLELGQLWVEALLDDWDPDRCGGKGGTPGPCPDDQKPKDVKSLLGQAASVAGKMAKLLASIPKAVAQKAVEKVQGAYSRLKDSYGPKWAKAIVAAGIIGTVIPVPGATAAAVAPVLAAAKLYKSLSVKVKAASARISEAVLSAHRDLILDAASRSVRRIAVHARRTSGDPKSFWSWLETFAEQHREVVVNSLTPPLLACCRTLGTAIEPADLAGQFLEGLKAELLDLSGSVSAAELEESVNSLCDRWEKDGPKQLAGFVLNTRRVGAPARTTAQALEILGRMPESSPGKVTIPLPVEEDPPYDLEPEDLSPKKSTVRTRELVATQTEVERDLVEQFIRDAGRWLRGQDMGNMPEDMPYIVESEGDKYVFDGHHRIVAAYLLGVTKIKVYLHRE